MITTDVIARGFQRALTIDPAALAEAIRREGGELPVELDTADVPPAPVVPVQPYRADETPRQFDDVDLSPFSGDYRRAWLRHLLPERHRALAFFDAPTVKTDLLAEKIKCIVNFWLAVAVVRGCRSGQYSRTLLPAAVLAAEGERDAYAAIRKFEVALRKLPPAPVECPRCGYSLPAPNGRPRLPHRP